MDDREGMMKVIVTYSNLWVKSFFGDVILKKKMDLIGDFEECGESDNGTKYSSIKQPFDPTKIRPFKKAEQTCVVIPNSPVIIN